MFKFIWLVLNLCLVFFGCCYFVVFIMVWVVFIYLDFGIGGVEWFVVDVGLVLKLYGYEVYYFILYYDKLYCFEEIWNGLLSVICVGDWFFRYCFGYFYVFWVYIRMIYVFFYLIFFLLWWMDVIFCD